jgi:hypothetical protein
MTDLMGEKGLVGMLHCELSFDSLRMWLLTNWRRESMIRARIGKGCPVCRKAVEGRRT